MKAAVGTLLMVATAALGADDHHIPEKLTLADAEALALRQSPEIGGAVYREQAAQQVIRQVRSGYFPQVTGIVSLVGTGTDPGGVIGNSHTVTKDTRIGASGGLSNSTILSRQSNGFLVSQLITDFGRTGNLTSASRYLALSESQKRQLVQAQVLLGVDDAYFRALEAEALLGVANDVVKSRGLLLEQVNALARAQLKSEIDMSVARASVSEANLLLLQAQGNLGKAYADLSASLGYQDAHKFVLREEPQYPAPGNDVSVFIRQAFDSRPDALAARSQSAAARKFASAEGATRYPKISALAALGTTPLGDDRVTGNYAAAGVNIEVPVFDGGRLSAKYQEAVLKAEAARKAVEEVDTRIVKDVTSAWLDTLTALKKIEVSRELSANSAEVLQLAEARYRVGSVSIIELSQAQLNKTQADIAYESAKYDYQRSHAVLKFQSGSLGPRSGGR